MELEDRLYTTEEVAKLVNASKRSIYRYVEEGKLITETKTAAGTFRFTKKAILDFLYPKSTSAVEKKEEKVVEKPLEIQKPSASFKYFKSTIIDPKSLAHTIRDKASADGKKYAFTLFAGFSLHMESPVKFSTVHLYVRKEDLDYWKSVLGLNDASKEQSNVCLIIEEPINALGEVAELWDQNSYDINGFKLVSDDRLQKDLEKYSDDSRKLADILSAKVS